MGKMAHGVGTMDADYEVQPMVNGKRVVCQIYTCWHHMLGRCYSKKFQEKNPTYIGCTVCKEWLTFSNFKAWMETQDWKGKHLDKDLILIGNKVYGPNSCIFVTQEINNIITAHGAKRGDYPIGVFIDKRSGKFRAHVSMKVPR